MIKFLYECPVCQHQFRGKGGQIKCTFHLQKKHPKYVGAIPINKCKIWVDGKWKDYVDDFGSV